MAKNGSTLNIRHVAAVLDCWCRYIEPVMVVAVCIVTDNCSAGEDNRRDVAAAKVERAVHTKDGTFTAISVTSARLMEVGDLLVGVSRMCVYRIWLCIMLAYWTLVHFTLLDICYCTL